MEDLDVDTGIGTISKLLGAYQTGKVKREDAATQVLTFVSEATQGLALTGDDRKQLEVYVMTLLRKLEIHELDPDTAAADLGALRRAAELNDPEFSSLTAVGGD